MNPSRGEKLATGACCCRSARSNCADHHALTSCRGGWRGWEEVLADEGNVSTYGSDLEAWLSDVRKVPRNAIAAAKDRVRLAAGPWRQVTCPGGSKWRHALHHAAPPLQHGASPPGIPRYLYSCVATSPCCPPRSPMKLGGRGEGVELTMQLARKLAGRERAGGGGELRAGLGA